MSVISIRPASETLKNRSSQSLPNRMPHFLPASQVRADKSVVPRAVGDLARAIQRGGAQIMSAAFGYGQLVQEERDKTLLAEAGADYQERLRIGFTNPEGGFLSRQGKNAVGVEKAAGDFMGDTFKSVCEDKKITGRLKQLFELHVNPVNQSWLGRASYHELAQTMRWRNESAELNAQQSRETWQATQFAPTVDPDANVQMAAKLISDYERDRRVAGDDETTCRANVRKYTQGLAADMILGRMAACADEKAFDEFVEKLKNAPESFIKENEAIYAQLCTPRDINPADYDTKLDDDEEAKYQEWRKTLPKSLQYEGDYDLRGYWKDPDTAKEGLADGSHLTDKYKKPNHETFSVESKYAVGDDARLAGRWNGDKFVPAPEQAALPRKTIDLLIAEARLKKDQFVRGQTKAVNDQVDALISRAGEAEAKAQMGQAADRAGALAEMDSLIEELARKGEKLEEGSRIRLAAFQAAERLDKSADKIAAFQLMDDLSKGVELMRDDGTSVYPETTRKGRLLPKVYAAFNEQRRKEFNKGFRERRERQLLAEDALMMNAAAKNNPQGYYNHLAEMVAEKHLTPGDFTRLRDKFNNSWMKGFKGAPGQMSKQSEMAKAMLDYMQEKLGVDMSTAIKTNGRGEPAIRNGAIDWDDKAIEKGDVELPDATVRRTFKKVARHADTFFLFGSDTGTRKEKIEGQQLRKALDTALMLWSSDGAVININPVDGKPLPEGKTHTVNAVEDFKALVDRLVNEKEILRAADVLKQQGVYKDNVIFVAGKAELSRQTRMATSGPVTDRQIEADDE